MSKEKNRCYLAASITDTADTTDYDLFKAKLNPADRADTVEKPCQQLADFFALKKDTPKGTWTARTPWRSRASSSRTSLRSRRTRRRARGPRGHRGEAVPAARGLLCAQEGHAEGHVDRADTVEKPCQQLADFFALKKDTP